ncbi:MAG: hypothetical protein KC543_11935 [Myxococcales bacterium]|nr:hypothetical protein [Myxococcales bacterium]
MGCRTSPRGARRSPAARRAVAPIALLALLAVVVTAGCLRTVPSRYRALPHAAGTAYCSAYVEGSGVVDVERDYLPRVLACENHAAGPEALRAQAIAARSYLYYELERRGSITDGETDQVYTCGRSPTPAIYDAVRATAGVVARYRGEIVATFYVAGATQVSPSCAQPVSDRTTTERYVTYNLGRSGDAVIQSPLGYINPANVQNRGAMSQNGANCLADSGWRAADILRFYYGTDLTLTRALGPCVRDSFDSVPTLRAELQPPAGAPRTAGGERLDGRVAFGDPGAPQGAAGVGGVAAGGRSAAVGGSREAPDVAWPAPSTAAAPSKPARVVPSTTHEVEVPPPSERPVRLPRGVTPMPTTRRDTRPTATPARPQPGSGGTRPGERPIDWDPPFDPG